MLSIGETALSALTAVQEMTVVQLGFAITPLCFLTSSGFISGTTRGTSGHRRNALELSINTAPDALISSTKRSAISFSAAPRMMSRPSKFSLHASTTTWPFISLPAEFRLASSLSSPTGKLRSARILIISCPTAPVAPRIPTLYFFILILLLILQSYYIVRARSFQNHRYLRRR